jgi:hypothetical protein
VLKNSPLEVQASRHGNLSGALPRVSSDLRVALMIAKVATTITSSMFARKGQVMSLLPCTQRENVDKIVAPWNRRSDNEVMEV